MFKMVKMKIDGEELENEAQNAQNKEVAPTEMVLGEDSSSELSEKIWSVVSFESVAASNLTYGEANAKLKELAEKNISGLCVITDEAAGKI